MQMQLLPTPIDANGNWDIPTGGRTVCFMIERIESDLTGKGIRYIAMIEVPADMVKKPEAAVSK